MQPMLPTNMADVPRLLSGRPVLPPLSKKQEELLEWLIGYSEKTGYFPVLRETSTHFDLAVSRIQALLQQLEKRGYIVRTTASSRNIQLTELTKSWFERRQDKEREAQGTLGLTER